MGFNSFLCKYLGCETTPPPRTINLFRTTPQDVNIDAGGSIPNGIGVQALYTDDNSPAPNQELHITVVGDNISGNEPVARTLITDASGLASLDVQLPNSGYTQFEVASAADPTVAVYFNSRTNDMAAQIFLYAQPCQSVTTGMIEVDIMVVDYNGNPVEGANLVLEAHNELVFEASAIFGEIKEIGQGRYQGTIDNKKAGTHMLLVQDLDSRVIGTTAVHVLPGTAHHFEIIGTTDPRAKKPYNYVNLQVQIQDEWDNPLPPTNIIAYGENDEKFIPVLENDSVFFKVEAVGYQYLDVTIIDENSNLQETVTTIFAATWLSNPGLVLVEQKFITSLHVTPRPNLSTDHGTVTINFDPTLVEFIDFEPSGQFDIAYNANVDGDLLTLDFNSELSYAANDYPEGMYLGDILWNCLGEGETCFSLHGRMSPTTDPWEMCVQQKTDRKDCICINVISIAGNAASLTAGNAAADAVEGIFSSAANVANCCPILEVERHNSTITQAQVNAITHSDGTVSSMTELRALHASTTGEKANCINLKSIPMAVPLGPGAFGTGHADPTRGSIAFSPANTEPNVGPHEVGHILGLNHTNRAGALMRPSGTLGSGLSKDECETVFNNISKYKC